MKLELYVRVCDINYCFSVLNNCDACRLYLPDHFIIDCFKDHNHSYKFKAFFYKSKTIYSFRYFNSKTKLFSAIQKLLKEELYDVGQFY